MVPNASAFAALEARVVALERATREHAVVLAQPNASASVAADEDALSIVWLLVSSFIILLMQLGFCMLEAGAVTSKSTETIMIKNLLDAAFVVLVWWAIGYSFAFREGSGFIGFGADSMFTREVSQGYEWAYFFFQLNFAATASTIVSGAIAERAHILSYLCFSSICAAFICAPRAQAHHAQCQRAV